MIQPWEWDYKTIFKKNSITNKFKDNFISIPFLSQKKEKKKKSDRGNSKKNSKSKNKVIQSKEIVYNSTVI